MWIGKFHLPIGFDLSAVFLFALTGALAAMNREYDYVGIFIMALVSGVGGAIIRDGLFIQQGPPTVIQDWRYLTVILLASCLGMIFGDRMTRFSPVFMLVDALGLGIYAIVGVQKAIDAGLSLPTSVLIGVINAVGGSVIQDVLTGKEPLIFRPGQYYAGVALVGCFLFIGLALGLHLEAEKAALIAILLTFLLRIVVIRFDLRTTPMRRRSRNNDDKEE